LSQPRNSSTTGNLRDKSLRKKGIPIKEKDPTAVKERFVLRRGAGSIRSRD